jgi:hypothetical protein
LTNDVSLFFFRRVSEIDLEEETVQLRFRQRIGALLLNGALRAILEAKRFVMAGLS